MCGCKGCQEVTTLDLLNNTETTQQLPTEEGGSVNSTVSLLTCECGINLDIYNGAGILVESNQSGGYNFFNTGNIFFEFINSTIWETELGPDYSLNLYYNTYENRWELRYYDDTYDSYILLGVYYTDNLCPTSITSWDLNCNSFIFKPDATPHVITWMGDYINGKKAYYATLAVPFPSGIVYDWIFYWNDVNNRWEISRTAGSTTVVYHSNDNINCFPTTTTWFNKDNVPVAIYTLPVGVEGYTIKTSPIDCQCCDKKLTINIHIGENDYTVFANIVTDSAGNHLINGGYPYYYGTVTDPIQGTINFYIVFSHNQWSVQSDLTSSPTVYFTNSSTGICPYGYYTTPEISNFRIWVRGYDCGNEVEINFCDKIHQQQCEFATKVLTYLKHLQFGNTCCEELDVLKNDKRVLDILSCYDTRDIPTNTTNYNNLPYIQIKKLLNC